MLCPVIKRPYAFLLGALLLAARLPLLAAEDAPAVGVLPEEFEAADTDERELYRTAGRVFEAENYPAAAKNYRDFADKYPKSPRAADAQMMLAESLYRQALKESGASQDLTLKSFGEARGEFDKALRLIPKGDHLAAGAAFRFGEIELNLKRWDAARVAMEKIQADNPGSLLRGEVRLVQAQALLALKQAGEAHRLLKAALSDQNVYEDEPRMQLAYGVALFDVGNSSDALNYLEKLKSPLAYLYAARAHLALGKPLVAIERLRQLIQADPDGPHVELAQYLTAESFFASKDYPSALQSYDLFLRSYPRSPYRPGAMYKIGLCQFEREDYLAARGSFQSVLQLAPGNEFAELSLYMTGESYLKEKRLKEANLAYADMAASFSTPLGGTAYFKQGWTHYKQGEFPAAETTLRMMLQKHPDHALAPAAALLIGNVLVNHKRHADAGKAYQQSLDLLAGNKEPEERKVELREAGLALLSRANLLAKDYGALVSGYQYLLAHVKPTLNPWRAGTLLFIAEGYYRQALYDQALTLYQEILKSFPVAPESSYAVDGIAWAQFAKGEFAAAERERAKLAGYKARPQVAAAKTILADDKIDEALFIGNEYEAAAARYNQKKYLEALDAYEVFEKTYPQNVLSGEAALQSGWCYYRLEHYGQALKTWERVETQYAGTAVAPKAAWAAADTYFRAAQYAQAIAVYQRILQAYPGDVAANHARMRIAQSYYNAKDVVQAITAFEALLAQAPDSPEAGQVLDFLTQLLFLQESKGLALQALTRIADSRPGTPLAAQARFRIARHLFESGDHGAAAQALESIIATLAGKSETMDAQFYLAECYYQLKRYKDAALAYERFVNNYQGDKRFVAALFHLGASRFKIDDYKGASDAFKRLGKDYPTTQYAPVALYNAALAFRKLGEWEEAAIALKTYLKNHPEEAKGSNALMELVAVYEENRQFALSSEVLVSEREKLPEGDLKRLELTHRLAEGYAGQGQEAKALEEWGKAAASQAKSNPFRLAAMVKLAEHYEGEERWVQAAQAYLDISQNAADPALAEGAKARAQAARERISQSGVSASTASAATTLPGVSKSASSLAPKKAAPAQSGPSAADRKAGQTP